MSISKSQIILTKHALSRGKQRYVSQERIEQALTNPDKTINLEDNKTKFVRVINERQFQVVATYLPKENKWLVISAWVRGEEDRQSLLESILLSIGKLILWPFKKLFSLLFRRS
ncbi:hypothetical protein KC921_02000 [Candidatus Woesebacteria bacterium]|nr:hypothetical protein [Candidatus Woesebacteria bacterium]